MISPIGVNLWNYQSISSSTKGLRPKSDVNALEQFPSFFPVLRTNLNYRLTRNGHVPWCWSVASNGVVKRPEDRGSAPRYVHAGLKFMAMRKRWRRWIYRWSSMGKHGATSHGINLLTCSFILKGAEKTKDWYTIWYEVFNAWSRRK